MIKTIFKLLKLTGLKTYIAGVGMIAFGVYQITEGDFDAGMKLIMEGFALFGVRAAIGKME